MHRIWKALRDRRGFTLIEIAIVIAIIGILLLIALPLFSGARQRAYTAEARQIASEWKALAWSCLVEKNFKERSCDANTETGWAPPGTSDAWQWGIAVLACFNTEAAVTVTDGSAPAAGVCGSDTSLGTYALRVPLVSGVTTHDYVLVLRTSTGKVQESTGGTDVPAP